MFESTVFYQSISKSNLLEVAEELEKRGYTNAMKVQPLKFDHIIADRGKYYLTDSIGVRIYRRLVRDDKGLVAARNIKLIPEDCRDAFLYIALIRYDNDKFQIFKYDRTNYKKTDLDSYFVVGKSYSIMGTILAYDSIYIYFNKMTADEIYTDFVVNKNIPKEINYERS